MFLDILTNSGIFPLYPLSHSLQSLFFTASCFSLSNFKTKTSHFFSPPSSGSRIGHHHSPNKGALGPSQSWGTMGSQGNEPEGMTPLSPTSGKECFSKDNFLLSHQPGQTEHPGTAKSPKPTLLEQRGPPPSVHWLPRPQAGSW